MADNTQLPAASSGGDTIRTESLTGGTDQTSGLPVPLLYQGGTSPEVKVQLVKELTGRGGVDDGVVTRLNPKQVEDARCAAMLEAIWELEEDNNVLLREIRDAVV